MNSVTDDGSNDRSPRPIKEIVKMRKLLVSLILLLCAVPLVFAAGTYTDFVRINKGPIDAALATPMVSAATVEVGYANGNTIHVTGTTTITSFGAARQAGVERVIVFDGILTLTHNATTLILPGGANIITAAGDVAKVVADTATNWRVIEYQRSADAPGTITNGSFSGNATVGSFVMTPQTLIGAGAITSSNVELYNSATLIPATLASLAAGKLHIISQVDGGTAGHTVTLGVGTFDGTNTVATFNAEGDSLIVIGTTYNGVILVNNGVVMSAP